MNDLSAAERCVKCGLCLPHCPTFRLTGNEADSPRGRLSLIQLLDSPDNTWSPGLFQHLDGCLLCHACETMCPSEVPYTRLMDDARERLQQHRPQPRGRRLVRAVGPGLLTSRSGRRGAAALLALIRPIGAQRLSRLPGLPAGLKRALELVPPATPRNRARDQSDAPARGETLNLFTGCTGELFDRTTLRAARRLLRRLGYRVTTPPGQGCCGALHQHNGFPQRAQALAAANREAFSENTAPVITFASGCAAHLLAYQRLYPQANDLSGRVTDILDFIARRHAGDLRLKPLHKKVTLHVPCTQRHALGQDALTTVLGWIPGLEICLANPDGLCCGAAGLNMLTQGEFADQLRQGTVDAIVASGADILLTTNIGCALHLASGIRQGGHQVDVMHPVTLLESLLV